MSKVKASLRPVPFARVTLADRFWAPRQQVNREVTLPHEYRMCKETGRIDAFRLAWKPGDPNPPHIFWDSDVAKWIEAASYSLATHPDPALDRQLDEVIALVAGAQQPDGYLNTHFTAVEPEKRWTNLRDCHQLYCAGHLMEAAVAHYEATGKRALLDVLCRYADHIATVFGTAPGQKRGYCGHEEIELALVKLYRATGQARYLALAKYFIDERGRAPNYFEVEALARGGEDIEKTVRSVTAYWQAHKPVREQTEAVGHAVRAGYLYSAMADLAALTGDRDLLAACRRLWRSVTRRKMYVTGGVGARHHGEAFGQDYELPNLTAYCETCAAIALVYFAHRMLQLEADAEYADVLERTLYNGVLSGVGLDGRRFFYVNPLASTGEHHRQEWFGCACCPPNVARLLAAVGQYVCSTAPGVLAVHLFVEGEVAAQVDGKPVTLMQVTRYPWEGEVGLVVSVPEPARFELRVRIPGWCAKHALRVNGVRVRARVMRGYARLRRVWREGDRVELALDMPVQRIAAHPQVADDVGKIALQRGPLVYCLEQGDTPAVRAVMLPERARLVARFEPRLLGGVTVVEGTARAAAAGRDGRLYAASRRPQTRPVRIRAVPYCVWDNRAPGAMTVWVPRAWSGKGPP